MKKSRGAPSTVEFVCDSCGAAHRYVLDRKETHERGGCRKCRSMGREAEARCENEEDI